MQVTPSHKTSYELGIKNILQGYCKDSINICEVLHISKYAIQMLNLIARKLNESEILYTLLS